MLYRTSGTTTGVGTNVNPFDWSNWWKNKDLSQFWENWTTGWKDWVPDPAKRYVSSPIDLPVKVNPIFRGRQPPPAVESDLCSAILPFHDPFTTIYEDCIRPPLEQAGFRVMKADNIFEPRSYITENIWRLINRSALLVADVTDKNPNVFYELGIAHTVGRDVILISQKKEDVPFDIQNLQYFLYTANDEKGKQKLRNDLENLMKSIKRKVSYPVFWWQT